MFKVTRKRQLSNLLDKKFEKMLYPLNTVMSFLLLPNYTILDGFVTPNNRFQKWKAFAVTMVLFIVSYFRFKNAVLLKESRSSFAIASVYFDLFYLCSAFISIFASNIINTDDYAKLILYLQKALRNFRYVDKDLKRMTLWNWVSVLVVFVSYFVVFAPFNNVSIASLLNILPMIYFDFIVSYTIRVMWIIENELKMWVDEMVRCVRGLSDLESYENQRRHLRKMFESYCNIFNAFELFKKICQVPIVFEIGELICHVLIYLQANIDIKIQTPEKSLSEFILQHSKFRLMAWMLKHVILFSTLCSACESFNSRIIDAEVVCNELFNLAIPVPEDCLRLCKNVRRHTRARRGRVRVCGVRVDVRLPLRVAATVVSYIAVTLQFNFL